MKIEEIVRRGAKKILNEELPQGKHFYTTTEWWERGEEYGLTSEMIVVHDGGPLALLFNPDYETWYLQEEMSKFLAREGLYAEPCTTWYTAIYKNS